MYFILFDIGSYTVANITMNSSYNITELFDINVTTTEPPSGGGPPRPEPGAYTDAKEWLWKIIPPIVMLLGTFGNSLTIIVLLRQIKNLSSTAVYLLTLAFSDLLVLYLGPLRQWIVYLWEVDIRTLSNAGCKIHVFLTYFSIMFSSWLLVAVTIERVISVILPHKVKLGCTTMKAGIAVVTIFICVFGLNCHILYGYGQVYKPTSSGNYRCIPLYDDYLDFRNDILPWIDFVFTFVIPFVLLLTCNIIIIVVLRKNKLRRKKMSLSQKEKEGRSITVMLIMLCVVFFICLTPVSIYLIVLPYVKAEAQKLPFMQMVRQLEKTLFWHALTNCFGYLNSSTNFMFYFLSGSRFRAEVRALFTCKKAGKEGVFGNSTSGTRSTTLTNGSTVHSKTGSKFSQVPSGDQRENDVNNHQEKDIETKPKDSSNEKAGSGNGHLKDKDQFTNIQTVSPDHCEMDVQTDTETGQLEGCRM